MPFILTGKYYGGREERKKKIVFLFFSAAWKIIRSWLPAEAEQFIKFVDAKSITQFVQMDQLSIAMGGTVSEGNRSN